MSGLFVDEAVNPESLKANLLASHKLTLMRKDESFITICETFHRTNSHFHIWCHTVDLLSEKYYVIFFSLRRLRIVIPEEDKLAFVVLKYILFGIFLDCIFLSSMIYRR